jgi:hypothetical protein
MNEHAEHPDARRQRGRSWIWAAVVVEIIGLAIDAVWHGVLSLEVEPRTHGEMVRHLLTVHLVLYVGVVLLVVSTAWALVERARRSEIGVALPAALGGAAALLRWPGCHSRRRHRRITSGDGARGRPQATSTPSWCRR